MPVVGWARPAVGLRDINFRNARVMPNHIQTAVTEQCLEREQIAAIPQIRDRESMAEEVRVALVDVCLFS